MGNKLRFSGHETFNCRPLWLKKGTDFICAGKSFTSEHSVVDLGIGKNMVSSINYWVNSFGLLNDYKKLSELAEFIFGEKGKDKYLEDPATLWLLHYYLVKENYASIYSLFFNEFRKHSPEFTKERFIKFLIRYCQEKGQRQNENTLERDVRVFLKNYGKPSKKEKEIEDRFSSLFYELNLIELIDLDKFRIVNKDRKFLPYEIVLFLILDKYEERKSISFYNLMTDIDSVGNILVMNEQGVLNKIDEITTNYKSIIFSDVAGIKELQFKRKLDKWKVLDKYYEK